MVRCCIILQLLYNKSQLIVLRSRSRSCSCSCSWGITALKYATKLCSKRKINSRSLARSQHRAVQSTSQRIEQCSTMPLAIGKRSLQPNRKSQQQQQRCQLKRKCKAFLCISSKQQNEQLNNKNNNNNNTYNNAQ